MRTPLRVLLVEDAEDDALLLLRELRGGGYEPAWERVDTAEALRAALQRQPWDVIISDWVMPRFSAAAALQLIQQCGVDVPIIIVSGEVGEVLAVSAMKAGAHDFVGKQKLTRLVPAIERELREAEGRRARKRAEQERARLSAAVEQTADSVIITDPEGVIVYANPACAALTGYPLADLTGRSVDTLLDDTRPQPRSAELHSTARPGAAWRGSVIQKRKDGALCEMHVTVSPVHDADGSVINYVHVGRDVTRERELEAQLRQAQKLEAIGRLAGGVAHDFNNQLTVIKGCVQFLLAQLPPDDPCRADAERINTTVAKGVPLVRQLLSFSRFQPLEIAVLNLSAVVEEMAPVLHLLLGEQTTLQLRATSGLWPVRADRNQIEQVVANLVVNAADAIGAFAASEQGGTVTLETANVELDKGASDIVGAHVRPGAYVMLAVSDSGHGMSPEVRERVFEPFFTTKEIGRGSGLGLAAVFGIVRQHDGYVACTSALGQGTSVKVYLPPDQDGRSLPSEAPRWVPRRELPVQETVLVVEDEEHVRELLVRALDEAGYQVYSAGRADEALAVTAQLNGGVDLLVTDLVMPGESGRSLACRVTRDHPATRVLFISGYTANTLDLSEMPRASFLQKPFGVDDLLRAVDDALLGKQ